MKRSKLEAVLRRKIRLKITNRKRGRFKVTIPLDGKDVSKEFRNKKEALTWLLVKLRLLEEIVISVERIK